MKEQIISFELAKLAKDKGFDVESLYFYTKPNSKMYAIDEENRAYEIKNTARELYECGKHVALNRESVLLAPTQGLLQKWLRDIHGVKVIADTEIGLMWVWSIQSLYPEASYTGNFLQSTYIYNTYEKALEAGLEEALRLITNETIKSKN